MERYSYDQAVDALRLQGLNNSEIARQLGISRWTVKDIVNRLKNGGGVYLSKKRTITQLRDQGKTYREIAEELGMTKDRVEEFCRREGLGYSDEEKFRAMSENRKGKTAHNKGIYADWSKKINEKTNGRFEFVERISIKDSDEAELRIRCLICGTEKTVVSSMLRGTNAHRIRCSACFVEENRKAREEKKEQERIAREFNRLRKRQESGHQMSMKFCPDCGQLVDNRSKYCKEHREEHQKESLRRQWRNNEYKRRSRLKVNIKDKDISLEQLSERDGDVCWLCGQLVDWNDYEIRDGQKQCGNYYPSIDHIIPVSLDGEHSWDNVKLAHRICNSYRGAKPLNILPCQN